MNIVPVTPARYTLVAEGLTRAFMKDPVCCYLFPDARKRAKKQAWIFEHWIAMIAARNGAFTTWDNAGAALWFPPESSPAAGMWEQLLVGLHWVFLKLSPAELRRGYRVRADVERRKAAHITEPHWVLDTLGVAPEHQGKGVAGALLRNTLDLADASGAPAYVITHNPANVAFYQRFGFLPLQEDTARNTDLYVCALRRPPDMARKKDPDTVSCALFYGSSR